MNFDNNYRARNGQNNNKNRNRNRNRRPNSGGGGNNSGTGNAPNRVYESNGPDVKVRGTAQTVAEKYHQLGRDAQSAGDNVMAESYYQHAEHYYRIWASNQPVGQTLQAFRKPGDEGFEEEVEDNGEGDAEGNAPESGDAETSSEAQEGAAEGQTEQAEQGQNRNFRQRDNRDNRDGNGGRERFRPRWQNRRDGGNDERNAESTPVPAEGQQVVVEHERHVEQHNVATDVAEDNDRWEAPSFLTRPVPAVALEVPSDDMVEAPVAERKPRVRRPKAVVVAEADTEASPQAEDSSAD